MNKCVLAARRHGTNYIGLRQGLPVRTEGGCSLCLFRFSCISKPQGQTGTQSDHGTPVPMPSSATKMEISPSSAICEVIDLRTREHTLTLTVLHHGLAGSWKLPPQSHGQGKLCITCHLSVRLISK